LQDQSARQESVGTAGDGERATLPTDEDLFRCSKGLKIILLRMTRDPDLASDLCQDVLETVLQAIRAQRIQSVQALPAYLHACAKNIVMANARRAQRLVLDNDADAISPDATPLDHCEKAELCALAQKVLSELGSERDRALIQGFYVDGLSKQALMQTWQLDRDHFDKVLSRARLRMRELMSEKLQGKRESKSGAPESRVLGKSAGAKS
jgi:RNA polymerase sigma factor (sigma-70 family)